MQMELMTDILKLAHLHGFAYICKFSNVESDMALDSQILLLNLVWIICGTEH